VVDGEAIAWPGMKDAGFGEPIVGQPLNPGPRKAILLAASPKRPPPEARDVGPEAASARKFVGTAW
jgi:hypothetical protein